MSGESKTGMPGNPGGVTIQFGHKYTESENFSVVFQEGMALVEETAAYLDGEGRKDAKSLEETASLTYATESMRLTTRLMQLASWLLIRRAVNEGEMTPEQAFEEQNKVKFQSATLNVAGPDYLSLPPKLRELNESSISLYRRVMALDSLLKSEMQNSQPSAGGSVITDHMSRLTDAFGPMVDIPRKEELPRSSGE